MLFYITFSEICTLSTSMENLTFQPKLHAVAFFSATTTLRRMKAAEYRGVCLRPETGAMVHLSSGHEPKPADRAKVSIIE